MSKTIPSFNHYRDSQDTDCLNNQYYNDEKNFAKLPPELQRLHLEETIKEYGAELLEGDALVAAKNLGFYTPASSSDTDNSWLNTAANVISAIPKGLIVVLAASEALKAVGAFPTEYNPNHPSAEPAENPEPILHRSARNVNDMEFIQRHIDLDNQNCIATMRKIFTKVDVPYGIVYEIRAKCFKEPCQNQQFSSDQAEYLTEGYPIYWMAIHGAGPESIDIKYSADGPPNIDPTGEVIHFNCSEPAYPHVQRGNSLRDEGKYMEARAEYNEAFAKRSNYKLAQEGIAKLEELEKITTEVSSTSLIDEISTPTTNSTITEKGATPAEPNSTQYNGDSIPTASPHKQSAEGQGWGEYLKDKVGGIVGAGVGVIGTAALLCAAYKVKQYCNKFKGVFVIENEDTGNPDVYISLAPNNAANVWKLVEDNTDAGEQTDSIQVQTLGTDVYSETY
ncbi:hypothetical protein [Candidatus Tisiphia endosymbiont of Hybos culiciformis]|uniref:hypothetical protein n=1 Tax=Candidatus Tisiphia endosymbiont of Hybos culiciformis TaxID=3139331 RepID=UPI003CCB677C